MIVWKYKDEDRPKGQCYDCGRKYGGLGFVDVIVPGHVWELINPTYHKGAGILCLNCIAARCELLGVECEAWFASGPLKSVVAPQDRKGPEDGAELAYGESPREDKALVISLSQMLRNLKWFSSRRERKIG